MSKMEQKFCWWCGQITTLHESEDWQLQVRVPDLEGVVPDPVFGIRATAHICPECVERLATAKAKP